MVVTDAGSVQHELWFENFTTVGGDEDKWRQKMIENEQIKCMLALMNIFEPIVLQGRILVDEKHRSLFHFQEASAVTFFFSGRQIGGLLCRK